VKARLVRKTLGTLRRAAKIKDVYWSSRMQAHRVAVEECSLEQPGRRLRVHALGLSLAPRRHEFVLKGLRDAVLLVRRGSARFSLDKEDRVLVEIGGIRVIVESNQDIQILKEIFIAGVYNIAPLNPTVVIDIGINVGYTSLFFAGQPNVVAVHGFEPFEPTFRQLEENRALNPALRKRIHSYNVGLGAADSTLLLPYNYQKKGSMGVAPLKPGAASGPGFQSLPITIASARRLEEFTGRLDPSHELLLKIDCEGADYDILPALHSAGLLERAGVVALEWHGRGAEPLAGVLRQAGFTVLTMPDPADERFGMIYAMRHRSAVMPASDPLRQLAHQPS
jgi:FkbM family methyltransferase